MQSVLRKVPASRGDDFLDFLFSFTGIMSTRSRAAKEKKETVEISPYDLKWETITPSFYALDSSPNKQPACAKIAAFDMDHTLVVPSSGRKFPTGRNDWKWWDASVPGKLQKLFAAGFKIVIFTNQGGIEKGKQAAGEITGKILDLCQAAKVPMLAFVAAAEDNYRKPFPMMWEYFVEEHNEGVDINFDDSFYCGDAAGRAAGWKKGAKKDFSVTDRKFAMNVGLSFLTPEEFFLEEEPVEYNLRSIDPASLIEQCKAKKLQDSYASDSQELVIVVGRPSSGKSTFTHKYFVPHGYTRVNRDTLGSMPKCVKMTKEALSEGLSVIVDNTNGSSSAREQFIELAQAQEVPVRCFYLKTSQEIANHLNYVRVMESEGEIRRIPDVAYRTFNKNFEAPEKSEGFTEIIEIDFIPDLRGDETFSKQFKCLTPEGI